MSEPLHILLCDPVAADAARLVDHLTSHGTAGNVTTIAAVTEVPAAMASCRWDLILCAHSPTTFEARKVLDIVRAADPGVPIIVLASAISDAEAAALFIAGARDVISKTDVARLAPVIAREIETSRIRRSLTQAIGRAELHFRNIVESSLQGIIVRANAKTQFVNSAFCKIFGYSRDEMMNLVSMADLHPPNERARIQGHVASRYSGDMSVHEYEIEGVRKDGSVFWCSKMTSHVEWDGQIAVQIIVVDITERKQAEQQLAQRERSYRETFQDAPIAMIRSGFDRKIIEANKAFAEMLGYTMEDVIGLRAGDFIPMSEHPSVIPVVRRIWDREVERADTEHRMVRKDGREIWVHSSGRLTADDGSDDQPIQLLTQFQDITDRKQAEDQRDQALRSLARNERQYRELFDHAPVAVCALSPAGAFLQTNRAFRDLLGYSEDDILHMHPLDMVETSQRATAQAILEDASGKTKPGRVNHDIQMIRKDGVPVWVWISGTLVFDDDGKLSYILSHLQDITARKQAEAQLFQSQKMEALGNLAGGIAHDFNNMLLPIIALTALTKEDLPSDSPIQENLDTVIEAAEKARRIVAQILAFSRQDQAPPALIAISHCVSEAVILVRNILPSSITIINEIEPAVGTVLADSAQLHSVVLNLGSNAAHAMYGKAGEMTIGLTAITADAALASTLHGLKLGASYARLRVRDTGCGMDKETLDKIFNPFFTTKPVGEGTGLGLSMVHGIIERFDGAIHVTSEVDVGTCFDLYLPLQDDEPERHPDKHDTALALM